MCSLVLFLIRIRLFFLADVIIVATRAVCISSLGFCFVQGSCVRINVCSLAVFLVVDRVVVWELAG
ncbi:hypothetical protein BDU57DRAFT_519423 [Ampelomyces quisqualis]|uniref:Uncharacterized protein n=1 Tax=Ampelomyces quisqualis TaxID=50730 RepID=A0A6A5QI90_AMPQU|nr:hypothetical protein BDU57DRAFT_519423 [Ampelomyces quisqualis]